MEEKKKEGHCISSSFLFKHQNDLIRVQSNVEQRKCTAAVFYDAAADASGMVSGKLNEIIGGMVGFVPADCGQ